MLCRPVPKHSFIRRNLRSIYHALKCDAEDSKARLTRGKCFTRGGRRGGHGSSEARSTLSLVPQLDCLKTPKSSTFALGFKRIAQLPRLYIGDFVTTPEHAQSSETLHHFFWGLVDISPDNRSTTTSHPSVWDVRLSELRCLRRSTGKAHIGASRIRRSLSNGPSALRCLGHRLSVVLKQPRGPQGRVVIVGAFRPRTGLHGCPAPFVDN